MMKRSLLLLAALGLAGAAHAHYLWATLDPTAKTLSVGLQEIPGDAPLPLGERAAKVKAWPLAGLQPEGAWLKAATPAQAAGASLDYGVLDKRDAGRGLFWLEYYAKAAATPEASQTKLGLPVELSAVKGSDGRAVVTVWSGGKPIAGADVIVEGPVGTNTLEGKTGADGTIALPASSGPIAVRALVVENAKGVHDGKAYDLVRRYSTLTVGAAAPAPRPFSRVLRDSFGDNHDVVSHTAFIETVMAGKLTKAQLTDHLRQREIVNTALDEILKDAKDVPYGPRQQEVLTLLGTDLKGLDAAPAEAWPLTQGFVDEIRASAKQGPYFALGVFHVYYGGITNGGRDVGAMIADQTKFTPTYYLKSEGYMDYLKRLNALSLSPKAQKEAIRGGQAAYRYIIAVNGEGAFKAKP